MKSFYIGKKKVSSESTFIVAEMSGNHGGDINVAKEIIRAAQRTGADAVKLQTYTADTITLDCDREDFLLPDSSAWSEHKTLHQLYDKAHTPWEWHKELYEEARSLGMEIFSSPFDESAVDLLEELDSCAYKVASPEIFHIPLIERIAKTGKPVIVSTGLAELSDIELAVETLRSSGCQDIIILKCTTAYPAPFSEVNLATMQDIQGKFGCHSGLSDHTKGLAVPISAVALGACFVEKHFTIDAAGETVDSFFSLNEAEFSQMVSEIRNAELAVGKIEYDLTKSSKENLRGCRSIYVSKDINAGETITKDNIKVVRPGFGLHPKHYSSVLGKKVTRNLLRGDRLNWEQIEG